MKDIDIKIPNSIIDDKKKENIEYENMTPISKLEGDFKEVKILTSTNDNKKIKREKLESLNVLRVIAVTMIIYDHLGAFRNKGWKLKKIIDFLIAIPFGIIQDFGAFGVSLFLIISGFLYTYNDGNLKKPVKKNIKKIIILYLTCLISYITFGTFQALMWNFHKTYWSQFSPRQWINGATLIGYFNHYGDVINGTTWFLIPFFFFYILATIFSILYTKLGQNTFIILEVILAMFFTVIYILKLRVSSILVFVYLPLSAIIIGEYCKDNNNISLTNLFIFEGVNIFSLIIGLYIFNRKYYITEKYLISFIYAMFMLIIFYIFNNKFKENKIVNFICKISYSLYLLQMTFGGYFMSLLENEINFSIAYVIVLSILILLSWIFNIIIEKNIIHIVNGIIENKNIGRYCFNLI